MADRTAHLTLNADGRHDIVVLDGTTLPDVVSRLILTAGRGERPTLLLELVAGAWDVGADGLIAGVSPAGHAVLVRLGWQPPGTPGQVGRCGQLSPRLYGSTPVEHCALAAGHAGWHRSDAGAEWSPATSIEDPTRAALEYLGVLVREVLSHFHEHGHPGRPCRRTGWVTEEMISGWWAKVESLNPPPPSQPAG